MERLEVYYSGHVQGVGFRYTVQTIASRLVVTGFVKNLPDGRVYLVAEGEAGELTSLVEGIGKRMADYVDDAETEWPPPTGEFVRFEIRY